MVTNLKKLIINAKEQVVPFHLSQLQENVNLVLSSIINSQFQNGVFKTLTLVSGSDNIINHGLDRSTQGWVIVDKNAQADIWQSTTTNNLTDKLIYLRTSANVTIKIYFF